LDLEDRLFKCKELRVYLKYGKQWVMQIHRWRQKRSFLSF